MPLISFKEAIMLVLGFALIYSLYYLRTHDDIFTTNAPLGIVANDPSSNIEPQVIEEPKPLSQAVLETVEIPDWLSNKDEFEHSNLTAEDLFKLAQISHEQDHDFFPDNQNTLVYLLKAKELGFESDEIENLLTTVHATLYSQAEQAIVNYDAETLTALTARLKSIDPADSKIESFTNQISLIYTLERLSNEINQHIINNRLFEENQNDAVHTLVKGMNLDKNYPPFIAHKSQLLQSIAQTANRAAQELDFTIADQQTNILKTIDPNHLITNETINEITNQKQNRFTYLDQQFYAAIDRLDMDRAETMMDELNKLEIPENQISAYENLLEKTKVFGPYSPQDQFSDLLKDGQSAPKMVVMPNGLFYMGSQTGPKHQRPQHQVSFSYGFAVSLTEVTVDQFKQFIKATAYKTTAEKINRAKVYDQRTGRFKDKFNINWRHNYLGKLADGNQPVIHVSWQDAQAYVNWLKSDTRQSYRLLSESEFEFVLSTNNDTIYPWGNDEPAQTWGNFSGAKDKLKGSRIKWREGFADYQDGYWGPAPVATFVQNLFGLHDLSGNVMEWVDDCWHDSYTRAPNDGSAWVNKGCGSRVIRGGNWGSANEEYQIHHRIKAETDFTDPRLGFRIAKTLDY